MTDTIDPTGGYSKEDLLNLKSSASEPSDFSLFWENTYDRVLHSPLPEIRKRRIWSPDPDIELYILHYPSWEGIESYAYLSRPKTSSGGVLIGHGYGNNPGLESYSGFTSIMPCSRGQGLSACENIPWDTSRHVLHRILERDGYVIRGVIADMWLAVSVMIHLYPDTAENLNYIGGSYGGGCGSLAVAWDKRITSAYLNVPTFGNNPVRLKLRSTGSGETTRLFVEQHPEALKVLEYYDSAVSAKYISVPVICSPAFSDACVIPPGQFGVANSLRPDLSRIIPLPVGHGWIPENASVRERIDNAVRKMFLKE